MPWLVLALGLLLAGCATPPQPDPLEVTRRKVFAFNDGLGDGVLAPVARDAHLQRRQNPVRDGDPPDNATTEPSVDPWRSNPSIFSNPEDNACNTPSPRRSTRAAAFAHGCAVD